MAETTYEDKYVKTEQLKDLVDHTISLFRNLLDGKLDDKRIHEVIEVLVKLSKQLLEDNKEENDPENLYWCEPILSFHDPTNGPPSTANNRDRYISSETVNGWRKGYIYWYDTIRWIEVIPKAGYAVYVKNGDVLRTYNGIYWVPIESSNVHNHILREPPISTYSAPGKLSYARQKKEEITQLKHNPVDEVIKRIVTELDNDISVNVHWMNDYNTIVVTIKNVIEMNLFSDQLTPLFNSGELSQKFVGELEKLGLKFINALPHGCDEVIHRGRHASYGCENIDIKLNII